MLDGQIRRGDGERIHAVIWYSDMRDSTRLADRLDPHVFIERLNRYFECTAGAVIAGGGEVLRFVGDAVLAIFPIRAGGDDARTASERALAAARDAESRLARANEGLAAQGEEPIEFGLGLHVGDVMYGNIGVPERLEFSVIGPAANEVARIEDLTKTLGRRVLVSEAFANAAGHALRAAGRASAAGGRRAGEGVRALLNDRGFPTVPAGPGMVPAVRRAGDGCATKPALVANPTDSCAVHAADLQHTDTDERGIPSDRARARTDVRMRHDRLRLHCHLGHARVLVAFDVVVRHLRSRGYQVTYVRNVTDIDDKIIARANENGEDFGVLTRRFIEYMHEDCRALGVLEPDAEPCATHYIEPIVSMVERLIDRGAAYRGANGDVYYDVSTFPAYGALSDRKVEDLRSGARVEIDEAKDDPLDFVLWKSSKPGEPSWESPWGPGRRAGTSSAR